MHRAVQSDRTTLWNVLKNEGVHDEAETAKLAEHCSEQGLTAKRMEWELVANAYHVHLLNGGRLGDEEPTNEGVATSYNARVTGLRGPWVFMELADDGAVSGRMHLRQLGGKRRLVVDEHGLEAMAAEPDHNGEHPTVLRLGQRFPCRLRGLDIWSGSCLLYTSPSPRDKRQSRMPSSA